MYFFESCGTCRVCYEVVSSRQEAVDCDRCRGWVHRLCGTGISQKQYRSIMRRLRDGGDFSWLCPACNSSQGGRPGFEDEDDDARDEVYGDDQLDVVVLDTSSSVEVDDHSVKPKQQLSCGECDVDVADAVSVAAVERSGFRTGDEIFEEDDPRDEAGDDGVPADDFCLPSLDRTGDEILEEDDPRDEAGDDGLPADDFSLPSLDRTGDEIFEEDDPLDEAGDDGVPADDFSLPSLDRTPLSSPAR